MRKTIWIVWDSADEDIDRMPIGIGATESAAWHHAMRGVRYKNRDECRAAYVKAGAVCVPQEVKVPV